MTGACCEQDGKMYINTTARVIQLLSSNKTSRHNTLHNQGSIFRLTWIEHLRKASNNAVQQEAGTGEDGSSRRTCCRYIIHVYIQTVGKHEEKNYWNSSTLIFITTHDNNYRKVPLHSHQQHEHPLLVQTLSFLEWKDTNTYWIIRATKLKLKIKNTN